MKNSLLPCLFCLVLLLSGCATSISLDEPPEMYYGEDICVECNMIISEPRFAAAYTTTDGEARLFDDIGGMLIYYHKHREEVKWFWVHDYDTEKWLKAEQAYFVVSDDIYTPMAFIDHARANEFAAEHQGMMMTLDELIMHLIGGVNIHNYAIENKADPDKEQDTEGSHMDQTEKP